MRKPRSKVLRNVLSHFRLAQFSNEHPEIDVETIVAFKNATEIGRRAFLLEMGQYALLAGLLTACSNPPIKTGQGALPSLPQTQHAPAADKTVAIVGAGIAGLYAAHQLQKAGIHASIYEGSGRVGGRILTHYHNALKMDVHPEFGGDFIDSDHADMIGLAGEFKLELIDLRSEAAAANLQYDLYYFDGRRISEAEIISEFKTIADQLARDIASMGDDYSTPAGVALDNLTLAAYIEALPCAAWLKEILTAAFIAEYGSDTSEQSAINMLCVINTDVTSGFEVFGGSDERFRIKHGNSMLPSKMALKLRHSIHTHHMLTRITEAEGSYVLSFEGKADIRADYVVLTIPFTMLKDVQLDLKDMTAAKRNSIDELGYGQANKLFVGYQSRPWREGANKFSGYLFNTEIQNGWDATTTEFFKNGQGVYCCYLGGKESLRLSDVAVRDPRAPKGHVWKTNLPEAEVQRYVDILGEVFPGSTAAYAGKHVFACWSTYPYVKACYTCPRPGQWNGAVRHAGEPIGNVFFAGEHCSAEFQGFMNGAAETGRTVAETIAAQIRQS